MGGDRGGAGNAGGRGGSDGGSDGGGLAGSGNPGGWSTGGWSTGADGSVSGPGQAGGSPGDSGNPGGWGASYGMNADGSVSPGVSNGGLGDSGNSLARGLGNLGSYSKREGGFFDGGFLGGTLSGLNTLASFTVPGYAPIGMGIGLANTAIGASNSLGLSDTGSLSPSLRQLARKATDGIGGLFAGSAGAPGMGLGMGTDAGSGLTEAGPAATSSGIPEASPSGMLGNLQGGRYNPLVDALMQQRSGPTATTPATSMPVQPGVPDPRSLAGLMARHNPMTPVQRG